MITITDRIEDEEMEALFRAMEGVVMENGVDQNMMMLESMSVDKYGNLTMELENR